MAVESGLYLHIPFCQQKCLYCDFPSAAGQEQWYEPYVTALCREIAVKGERYPESVITSLYIGGGTPSLLPATLLEQLLAAVRRFFMVTPDGEWSMEANPGTVTADSLRRLRAAGLNRISFGVQSLDDGVLAGLGRIHDARTALQSIELAQQAGFDNCNADLMYGLPGQTPVMLQTAATTLMAQGVPHLSVYGLKVEDGTPFAVMEENGTLALPDEAAEEEMYDWVTTALPTAGWQRYEISNYARDGLVCQHNLKYWRYQPYLGLGVAAHSFWGGQRFYHSNDVAAYVQGTAEEIAEPPLAAAEAMAEYCFLALRMTEGIDPAGFTRQFGKELTAVYREVTARLLQQELLTWRQGRLCLTERGMKYGNQVFAAFLPE